MAEQLTKLRPDRDLQCYFQKPSAIAALSHTSATGFTISGCWRDPFDWAIVEWNRDNVFEHPALRNLPDGDLSGIKLSYREQRTNCIPLDSSLYPTVEWPYLRIWAENGGVEQLYLVPLVGHATPTVGVSTSASATFTLTGTVTAKDYIELAWLDQHFNYQLTDRDTLETACASLAGAINNFGDGTVTASASGTDIKLLYRESAGTNGNRVGAYGTVYGSGTEAWSPGSVLFSGATSPSEWRIDLDFSSLSGYEDPDRSHLVPIPTSNVRKMRWTWAADFRAANFARGEFSAVVAEWSVNGSELIYQVAGPGSRRVEDSSAASQYSSTDEWRCSTGNFSSGSIHWTTTPGASVRCMYDEASDHELYLGTRYAGNGATISVQIDDSRPIAINLAIPAEDFLARVPLGKITGSSAHTVTITNTGAAGSFFYFDFLEIVHLTCDLPEFFAVPTTTLATDWDTDHSIALAPERTAWIIQKLGFRGRANHYAGALWFYELCRPGLQYASATISFSGSPEWGKSTVLTVDATALSHLNLIGDTADSIAMCFALWINAGSNSVWAEARGTTLTITARQMGTAGNGLAVSVSTDNSAGNAMPFAASVGSSALNGGVDGTRADPNGDFWRTDLSAMPRMNRAARDWSQSFFAALHSYGIEGTAAFSMELQHGDDSAATGIAQRYPNGDPAWLTTPSLQTNFGPQSTAFWQQVYADMASVMTQAGAVAYLQFGEVQWWYFPGPTATVATQSGLPLYDLNTTAAFQAAYGRPMRLIPNSGVDPTSYATECVFLRGLVGAFTQAVRSFVRSSYTGAKFEVLYPTDVNEGPIHQAINFPVDDWTASNLACLKTESFSYTSERDLNKATQSIQFPASHGFGSSQSSHLVGIGDCTTPWQREQQIAAGAKQESVVLFALDQFCLIGYALPWQRVTRRGRFLGSR